jgi:hypothetical protein
VSKHPKSQSTMVLEIVARIKQDIEKLREFRRKQVLSVEEQIAVLDCFFGVGPVATQQSPKQQVAVLNFLFGGPPG